jgi:hypothetical protein
MTARIETLKWTFEKTSRVSKPHLKDSRANTKSNRSIYTETARNPTNLSTQKQQDIQQILKQSTSKIYAC